jgi:hypothetical protein
MISRCEAFEILNCKIFIAALLNVSLPEEWVKLDEERKSQLREIILELRKLDDARSAGATTVRHL